MSRPRTTGSRNPFPEPLESDLRDFCEALLGAPTYRVVQAALRTYIDGRLQNEPELRRLFEEARKKRMGVVDGDNVTMLPTSQSAK